MNPLQVHVGTEFELECRAKWPEWHILQGGVAYPQAESPVVWERTAPDGVATFRAAKPGIVRVEARVGGQTQFAVLVEVEVER